jgi:NTE family protein
VFSEYGLRTEYYHPFTPTTHFFVAPRALIDDVPFYVYNENKLLSIYRRKEGGGAVDFGYQFGTTGELRVGYEGGWQKFGLQIGNPNELESFSGAYGASRIKYSLDRLDNAVIPRSGQSLQAQFSWTNASPAAPNPYPIAEITSQNYFRISEPSTIFVSGYAGTTFDYGTGLPQFSLGGSRELVAYNTNELLMDKYFLFQLGYIRELAKLPPLLGNGIYALGLYEAAQVYGTPHTITVNQASGFPTDAAAGIVVDTIFGPVEAAYAYGDTGHHKFFFRIGRLF